MIYTSGVTLGIAAVSAADDAYDQQHISISNPQQKVVLATLVSTCARDFAVHRVEGYGAACAAALIF